MSRYELRRENGVGRYYDYGRNGFRNGGEQDEKGEGDGEFLRNADVARGEARRDTGTNRGAQGLSHRMPTKRHSRMEGFPIGPFPPYLPRHR